MIYGMNVLCKVKKQIGSEWHLLLPISSPHYQAEQILCSQSGHSMTYNLAILPSIICLNVLVFCVCLHWYSCITRIPFHLQVTYSSE